MKSRYLDLLERSVWTFLQAALAVWVATDIDLFSEDAFKVAATAGAIAVAKCLLAFGVGSSNTAATLPAGPDTDQGGDDLSDHGHGDLGMIWQVAAAIIAVVLVVYVVRALL